MGQPAGALLSGRSNWTPYLDPTLEYCASITSFGFGDLARSPVTSNTICAPVTEVSTILGEPDAGAPDGGAVVGAGPDAAEPTDAAAPRADAGPRLVGEAGPSSCAVGGAARPGPLTLVLLALALRRRRRGERERYARSARAPKLTTLASSMFHCS